MRHKITIEFVLETDDPQTDEGLMIILGEIRVYAESYKYTCLSKEIEQ